VSSAGGEEESSAETLPSRTQLAYRDLVVVMMIVIAS